MLILNRYIARTIILTTLLVLVALMSMDFFIQLMNEVHDLGKGSYGFTQALIFVLAELPRDIYMLFPMVGLIGCLMGLGVLASGSELVVMRASGMTLWQITRAVLLAVLLMASFVTILGEVVAPQTIYFGQRYKSVQRSGGQAVLTQSGVWLREGQDFIHILMVDAADNLIGITRYQFDSQHRLVTATYAAHAQYQHHAWQLQQVSQTNFLADGTTVSKQMPSAQWQMRLNPAILEITQIEPSEMTLPKLHQWIVYRKQNNLRYNNMALNFWQRIFQPFSACVMMLLAVPFIFGPLRSAAMGLRLVAGVVVGFSFYILNQLFGPMSLVYQLPPFLGALMPPMLFALIGIWFILRMK